MNTSAEVEDVDSKYEDKSSAYKMQIGTDGSNRLSRLFSFLLKKKYAKKGVMLIRKNTT